MLGHRGADVGREIIGNDGLMILGWSYGMEREGEGQQGIADDRK